MAVGAYAAYNSALRAARDQQSDPGVPVRRPDGDGWSACCSACPVLRIKGFYLAVATLAAQFFLDWVFARVDWFTNYTPSGSVAVGDMIELFGIADRHADDDRYLFMLAIVCVLALVAKNLVRGRIGRIVDGDPRHGHRRRDHRHPPAATPS